MFYGEHEHALDGKGRVILPARHRARLSEGCVVTRGQEHCLYVYPRQEWDLVVEALQGSRVTSRVARNFTRLIFSGAVEQEPDGQGRISIPEGLRRYANLQRDVTVIGVGRRIEVWDRAAWAAHRDEALEQYSEMAEVHPDLAF